MDWILKIKELLSINKIKEALGLLKDVLVVDYPELFNEYILFSQRYNRLTREREMAVISRGDFNVEQNNLTIDLLQFLDKIGLSPENDENELIREQLFDGTNEANQLSDADDLLLKKAIASFNLEEYSKALESFKVLVERISSPKVLLNYGYLLSRNRKYDEALEVFRKLIDSNPHYVEAYLNAFRVLINQGNLDEARRYCDAAFRLAPYRKDVIQARALYLFERGETEEYLKVFGESLSKEERRKPTDEELLKVQNNPSTLIGNGKVSSLIVVFSNAGLRTVLLGYKDTVNDFPKPKLNYKWNPLNKKGRTDIKVELLDNDGGDTALLGVRANGLENTDDGKKEILGFILVDFIFESLGDMGEKSYLGLLHVDVDKNLRLKPQKIMMRELMAMPEGDLVDMYQDMLFPKSTFTVSKNATTPRVFLSYAREDYSVVDRIFEGLKKHGIDAWQDDKSLKIGDDYKNEIEKAINESDFAIVFLSSLSLSKTGYVSREFREILEVERYRPLGFPFTLPIKLDDCEVPRQFAARHWIEWNMDKEKDLITTLANHIKEQFRKIKK